MFLLESRVMNHELRLYIVPRLFPPSRDSGGATAGTPEYETLSRTVWRDHDDELEPQRSTEIREKSPMKR